MTEWTVATLIVIGCLFSVLAAIGIVRMPDLYMRIQAATKSSTLGVSCLVLAAAVTINQTGTTTRSLLVIAFLMLTAPVAAHMIGRAAYLAGIPLWPVNVVTDEFLNHVQRNADLERQQEQEPPPAHAP